MVSAVTPQKARGFFNPSLWQGFKKGTVVGLDFGFMPNPLNIAWMVGSSAFGFASAPRGHGVSHAISKPLGFGIPGLLGGIVGGVLGGTAGAYIGAITAQTMFEDSTSKGIAKLAQRFVDFGQNTKGMNFGGRYTDTDIAMTMRQTAAREMSRSLMNARQWLGQESAFMRD